MSDESIADAKRLITHYSSLISTEPSLASARRRMALAIRSRNSADRSCRITRLDRATSPDFTRFRPTRFRHPTIVAHRRMTPLFGLGFVDAVPDSDFFALATKNRRDTTAPRD